MESKYVVLELIGQGTYGRVYKVQEKATGKLLVVKALVFDNLSKNEQTDVLNEAKVMSLIDHKSLIRYHESFIENGSLHIVMEYCGSGDLGQLISERHGKPFKEDVIWNYLIQICEGLHYLHSKRILHRDLKPQNLFLENHDTLKIGDLGLGRILGSQTAQARSGVGTPLYFSPELCQDMPYDDKSDVWALGCLMYELITLEPPFLATNQIALAKKIVSDAPLPLPEAYSTELRFLVLQMLQKNPHKRPTMEQVLAYAPIRFRIGQRRVQAKEKELKSQLEELTQKMKTEFEQKKKELEHEMKERSLVHRSEKRKLMATNKALTLQLKSRTTEKEALQLELDAMQTSISEVEQQKRNCAEHAARVMNLETRVQEKETCLLKNVTEINMQLLQLGFTPVDLPTRNTPSLVAAMDGKNTVVSIPSTNKKKRQVSGDSSDELCFGIGNDEAISPSFALQTPQKIMSPPMVRRIPWTELDDSFVATTPSSPENVGVNTIATNNSFPKLTENTLSPSTRVSLLAESTRSSEGTSLSFPSKSVLPTFTSSELTSSTRSSSSSSLPMVTAQHFDLCPADESGDEFCFEVLYSWRKKSSSVITKSIPKMHFGTAWNNTNSHRLTVPASSLLVVYSVLLNDEEMLPDVSHFHVHYAEKMDEEKITLEVPSPIRLSSYENKPQSKRAWFVFDVPVSLTHYNTIESFELEFKDAVNSIDEIIILNYNRSFLHVAATPVKQRDLLISSGRRAPSNKLYTEELKRTKPHSSDNRTLRSSQKLLSVTKSHLNHSLFSSAYADRTAGMIRTPGLGPPVRVTEKSMIGKKLHFEDSDDESHSDQELLLGLDSAPIKIKTNVVIIDDEFNTPHNDRNKKKTVFNLSQNELSSLVSELHLEKYKSPQKVDTRKTASTTAKKRLASNYQKQFQKYMLQ